MTDTRFLNRSALALFGGGENVFRTLSSSVTHARKREKLSPEELGEKAELTDPSLVERLEREADPPSSLGVLDVISILAKLGLSLSHLLSFSRGLSSKEVRFWNEQRKRLRERPWVMGQIPADLDPRIALDLFIRAQALEELFGSGRERKPGDR